MMALRLARAVLHPALVFSFIYSFVLPSVSLAVTPITSSGLNTQVSAPVTLPSGQTQFNITGGTRPGGGVNLFHSFGDFNVPNNNIANFLNNSGLATSNILGRVTGGNVSNIFGTIQTTGFGNANLFLMNPAGFVFGPNAMVNVGGMVTFTSADYLRLSDGVRFNATPHTAPDQLLSAAPVAAFGFLGSNPGAITVQGSHLSVAEGTGISLVGGNITVQAGTLTAPSGQITLVSVGTPSHSKVGGEVANGSGFAPTGFKSFGDITLTQGSTIDTSSNPISGQVAGPVVIRGGQFVMNASSIEAVTGTPPSTLFTGGSIEMTAEHVDLSNHSSINTSIGNNIVVDARSAAGNITVNAATFSAKDSTIFASTDINHGVGGAVTIQGFTAGSSAHTVSLTDTIVISSNLQSGTGGPIAIHSNNISLNQSTLETQGSNGAAPISLVSRGRIESHDSFLDAQSAFFTSGTVDLKAGTIIDLSNTTINTSGQFSGTITLSAPFLSLTNSHLSAGGSGFPGGTISLNGSIAVSLRNSGLFADNTVPFSNPGARGTISIHGGALVTSDHSTLSAQSIAGNGGTIHIEANKVRLTDTQLTTSVSGGPQSVGGTITVDAKNTTLTNSQILSTATEGHGGTIGITAHKLHSTNSVIDATSQFGTDGTVTIQP